MDKTATPGPSPDETSAPELSVTIAGHFLSDANYHLTSRVLESEAVFIYTYAGAGKLIVHAREHHIRPGEGLLLFPGYEHEYRTEGLEWHLKWFHCRGPLVDSLKTSLDLAYIPPTPFDERSHVFAIMDSLIRELQEKTRHYETMAQAYAKIVLLELSRQFQMGEGEKYERGAGLVQSAAAYLRDNIDRDISVRDLEKRYHISPRHLTRLFQLHLGETPKQYALRAKISEAKRLLYLTNLTVGEVAERIGIRDPYYFSRLFHRKTGQSPTSFRTALTQSEPEYQEIPGERGT